MNISILGAGTWGVALAKILSRKHNVSVWSCFESEVEQLTNDHSHPKLPGVEIPENIEFTTDIKYSIANKEIIIIATPSNFVRSTTEQIKDFVKKEQIIVCVSKGIEKETMYFLTEVIEDVLMTNNSVVALSGPTHAEEVSRDIPTTIVSACIDQHAAKTVQELFVGTCVRPYTNNDVIGVELCAALKNIIALACGISDGIGNGDNTKAAIITRGISEIKKLGIAMECNPDTFSGLAGIGDLIVTAMSVHSRNTRCGQYIGQGMSVEDAIKKVDMVVEGINALPAAIALSDKYKVELPITFVVNEIVNNNLQIDKAINKLLNRELKSELMF